MKVSLLVQDMLTEKIIDTLLYKDIYDEGESATYALVLGSSKAMKYKVPVACDLYFSGRVSKMILSGGRKINVLGKENTEAYFMKETALSLGVPKQAIITEERSMYTKNNFILSMELIKKDIQNESCSLIVVTNEYHMRRSMALANKYLPKNVHISMCPVIDHSTNRDTWFLSEVGYQRAKNEAWKLISYVKEGIIDDFEI